MKTTLTLEDVERLEELKERSLHSHHATSELNNKIHELLPLILPVIREHVGNPEGLRPPQGACPLTGTDAPRAPMEHKLKVWKEFFPAIQSGAKPFEVRFNDRDFRAGDRLTLEEYDPEWREYTGQSVSREVLYVLHGWGLKDGFVCMGLSDSSERAKTAQEGSVCEVEPLGEIQKNGDLSFYDESGDELYISKHNQNIVIGAESGASMERTHVRSLIAHLQAWLATGSLDVKHLPSSPPSSEDTELLEECRLITELAISGFLFLTSDSKVKCSFYIERLRALHAKLTEASTTSQKGGQGA